jgi:hypothetical protein
MRARAELRPVGDGDLFTERDRAEIVNKRLLANRAPRARGKIPWKINPRGGISVNVRAHFRSKATQDKTTPSKTGARATAKGQPPQSPQRPPDQLTAGILPGPAVCGNVQGGEAYCGLDDFLAQCINFLG